MVMSKTVLAVRRAFTKRYGRQTASVVRYTCQGWSSYRIATKLNMSVRSVSSTRGNLTRGFYNRYVDFCQY